MIVEKIDSVTERFFDNHYILTFSIEVERSIRHRSRLPRERRRICIASSLGLLVKIFR